VGQEASNPGHRRGVSQELREGLEAGRAASISEESGFEGSLLLEVLGG